MQHFILKKQYTVVNDERDVRCSWMKAFTIQQNFIRIQIDEWLIQVNHCVDCECWSLTTNNIIIIIVDIRLRIDKSMLTAHTLQREAKKREENEIQHTQTRIEALQMNIGKTTIKIEHHAMIIKCRRLFNDSLTAR